VRRRAPEVRHRGGPAHDLFDGGRRDALEVLGPDAALRGGIAERLHAVTDRVARGLVARHDQQDEERGDLLLVQPLAVDVGVDQRRGQVVGGALTPGAHQALDQRRQLLAGAQHGGHGFGEIGHVVGIGRTENDVAAVEDVAVLVGGDAHHVADDLQRQRRRDLADEVAAPGVDHAVDDVGGRPIDRRFGPAQHAGREAARHDAPQPRVTRIVHGDHRAEELD
jgi:hypothetical protein